MDGSSWRVLAKRGPLEMGMADHFIILASEPHEQYEEAKRTSKNSNIIKYSL